MRRLAFATMHIFILGTILPTNRQRKAQIWLWLAGFIFFASLTVFLNIGRWLIAEDPLDHASAIVVLSGRMPSRVLEAARIYRAGYASEVWLTHLTEPGASLARLSVPYSGEEVYDRLVLIEQGVPENSIRVIDPPIVNTQDEILAIGQNLEHQNQRKIIIVTSKVHTRRARALWNRLVGNRAQAIIRGVSDDGYDPAHWWRNTSDALDVVREFLGMLNAWAGLPLRPAT